MITHVADDRSHVVAADDRWGTAALPWPPLDAAPRNVNCRRAINTNAGLLKTLKGTKAGMGLGAVGGLYFAGPAGAVGGFAAGAVMSKEPQGAEANPCRLCPAPRLTPRQSHLHVGFRKLIAIFR